MKKYRFSLLCLCIFSSNLLPAQYLTGRIVDRKTREPIAYTTVYISELQQGLVANMEGTFELAAPEGSYHLIVACMGYQTARLSWQSGPKSGGELKIIELEEAEYQIAPLYVTPRKEDPAITIMRKAIGMAPYYRNLVQSYTAEVYLKENINMTKLKDVVLLALKKDQRNALKNLSGIQESVSEIKFTAPDKYVQTSASQVKARCRISPGLCSFRTGSPHRYESHGVLPCA